MKDSDSCGRIATCGGLFSSGPGDSDWRHCKDHRADLPHFGEVLVAQLRAAFEHSPVPTTADECVSYLLCNAAVSMFGGEK